MTTFHMHSRNKQPAQGPGLATAASAVDDVFETWRKDPTPDNFYALHQKYEPSISSAIKSVGGDAQELRVPAVKLLHAAATSYDPTKGAQFSTHLHNTLRGLNRAKWDRSFALDVPERVRIRQSQLLDYKKQYESENGRQPNDDEVFEALGSTEKQVNRATTGSRTESNETAPGNSFGSVGPAIHHDDDYSLMLEALYTDAVADEDKLGQDILIHHFRYGGAPKKTQTELAALHGVSVPAVNKRVMKLREVLGDRY